MQNGGKILQNGGKILQNGGKIGGPLVIEKRKCMFKKSVMIPNKIARADLAFFEFLGPIILFATFPGPSVFQVILPPGPIAMKNFGRRPLPSVLYWSNPPGFDIKYRALPTPL